MGYFAKFFAAMKYRDPNNNMLRQQFANLQIAKMQFSSTFAICLVIGTMAYEQLQNPSKVKVPKQDGQSLVT